MFKYLLAPILLVVIDSFFDFQVLSNDFFGYLGLASILDFEILSTYYNGVYPPGYVWILKLFLLSKVNILLVCKALNYLSIAVVFYLIKVKFYPETSFLLAFTCFFFLVFSNKLFLTTTLAPGSYPMFLLCITLGTVFYNSEQKGDYFIASFFLILATLIRFEGFIWIICLSISKSIIQPKLLLSWKLHIPFLISFFFLAALNYWATSAFFASKHFLTFESPAWLSLNPDSKFQAQIPLEYFIGYLHHAGRDAHYLVLLLLAWIFLKPWRWLIATSIFYLLLIKLHSSPRGIFLVLPFCYIFLYHLIFIAWTKIRWLGVGMALFLVPAFIYFSLNNYFDKRKKELTSISYQKVGLELSKVNKDWQIDAVFTNSHDFYLANQLPKLANVNGGWVKLVPLFYSKNPNFDLENIDEFYTDLLDRNIKFLIIDSVLLHPSVYSKEAIATIAEMEYSNLFKKIAIVDERFFVFQVVRDHQQLHFSKAMD